jgi:RNA polymerase primary sigma factor
MPPARKSAAKTTAARATRQATRREVEQSIARFEKQLDGANDALKALGGHLGRGATGSYKEVTTALTALRREASKTNKQALKDFDKLRAAVTRKPAASNSASKTSSRATKKTTTRATKTSTAKASSSSRSTAKRSTAKRSTATGAKTSRAKSTRSKKAS